jgi:hypothetical protein
VAGDWNSDGKSEVGLYMPSVSMFFLSYTNTTGYSDLAFGYGVPNTWLPVAGNWSSGVVSPYGLFATDEVANAPISVANLTNTQLQPIITAAISRWANAGFSAAVITAMQNTSVTIADLPGTEIGMTQNGAIEIDINAAGHGWFVDSTPNADEEFTAVAGQKSLQATDSHAIGYLDLLTAVSHELGHIAGLPDLNATIDDLMANTLSTGTRRLPGA